MMPNKDCMKFFLSPRYFQSHRTSNGMHRSTCISILARVFNMSNNESAYMMHVNSAGFWIVCRLDQFARFIV